MSIQYKTANIIVLSNYSELKNKRVYAVAKLNKDDTPKEYVTEEFNSAMKKIYMIYYMKIQ